MVGSKVGCRVVAVTVGMVAMIAVVVDTIVVAVDDGNTSE